MTSAIATRQIEFGDGELNGIADAAGLPDELKQLIGLHTQRFFQYLAAQHAARQAEAAIPQAEATDRQNRAAALAGSGRAPKDTAPAARQAAEDAQRQEQDLAEAVHQIETKIKDSIAAHRDQWLQVIDAEDTQLQQTIVDAAETVRQAFVRRRKLALVRAQVLDPHNGRNWGYFSRTAAPLALREHNDVSQAVDTLRRLAGAPPATPFFTGA